MRDKKGIEATDVKGIAHDSCGGDVLYEERKAHEGSVVRPNWLTCKRCRTTLWFNVALDDVVKNPEFYGAKPQLSTGRLS